MTAGTVLLALFGYGIFSNDLLSSLENKYPPLLNLNKLTHVKWVVVLSAGHVSDPKLPVTGQISNSGLARLVEGIRIHSRLPESKLIVAGGAIFDPVSEAKIIADVTVSLRAKHLDIFLEPASRDTKDQARQIHEITGKDPFILVTSASHMPRSMALFRKLGMKPIPAPTDYRIKKLQGIHPGSFFPSSGRLQNAERVLYEYLGLAWAKFRDQI
jgi:uncharacterized SAM-binding protein YcdF (DUF218 family)